MIPTYCQCVPDVERVRAGVGQDREGPGDIYGCWIGHVSTNRGMFRLPTAQGTGKMTKKILVVLKYP